MRVKSNIFVSIVLLVFISSCVTHPPSATPSGPKTIILDGDTISESVVGKFVSWRCVDYYDGGRTLLEVGYFSNPAYSNLGYVLYDGGYIGVSTKYRRAGLDHRWDWDFKDGAYNYAFTIDPEGFGQYYDFTTVAAGENKGPSGTYKCIKRLAIM